MIRFVTLFLILSLCLVGQTTQIRPDQLAVKTAPADLAFDGLKLVAYSTTTGALYSVVLNGFSMSISGGNVVITAPASQATEYPVLDVQVTRQVDGSWMLGSSPGTKVVQLYRNGLRQYVGVDYTIDILNPLKVLPVGTWASDDRVTANFFRVS